MAKKKYQGIHTKDMQPVNIDGLHYQKPFYFCLDANKSVRNLTKYIRLVKDLENFQSYWDLINEALEIFADYSQHSSMNDLKVELSCLLQDKLAFPYHDIRTIYRESYPKCRFIEVVNHEHLVTTILRDTYVIYRFNGIFKGRLLNHKRPSYGYKPTDNYCNLKFHNRFCYLCGKKFFRFYRRPEEELTIDHVYAKGYGYKRITICKSPLCMEIQNTLSSAKYNHVTNMNTRRGFTVKSFKMGKQEILIKYLDLIREKPSRKKKIRVSQ